METFLIKAAQLILAFAILVIIHEFGHFLFSRVFGVRVEKFYIFFNPWFSLFKWKPKRLRAIEKEEAAIEEAKKNGTPLPEPVKRKYSFWGETQYGIGWLPLGGYCKIAGMIDESMDTEQMQREPQKWEFRAKPAWQRLLIMVAGVLFNFIAAIVIYAGIVYWSGEKYVPLEEATLGMAFSDEAKKVGFMDGDIPLTADGVKLSNPVEARSKMIQASTVTVLRGADTVSIAIPEKFIFALDEEAKREDTMIKFMTYRIPTRISQVTNGEGAAKAGIQVNDEIIAINDTVTPDLFTFQQHLAGHDNQTVNITLLRANEAGVKDTLNLPVALSSASKMGVGLDIDPASFFKFEEKKYGLFESIPRGIELGVDKLTSYVGSMKLVFTKEGAQSIGGFGAIGSIFPDKWDWLAFWNIAAFLSVALAFMNILPIPALDGGHVLFLLYEVITRRQPSLKFMEYAQMVGMAILFLLLIYANGMDIVRLFK